MTERTLDLRRIVLLGLILGLVLGVTYTLSPLTVLFAGLFIVVTRRAGKDLSPREKQWFFTLIGVAITVRLLLVAALFVTADPARPWVTIFGDEELFKSRSVWLRNLGLGLPISPADTIYVYDETGQSSYLNMLAVLQALAGNAPYGMQVMNATLYITGVVVLYRLVRPVFGGLAAMGGLAILLYLPTLFVWSVSALKEPVYTLAAVAELLCAVYVARAPRMWQRLLGVVGVIAGAVVLDSLRKGGWPVALIGSGGGLVLGFVVTRPRLAVASFVAAPIVALVALSTPPVRDSILRVSRRAALYHSGHILTPGYSYQILDPRYYENRLLIARMPPRELGAFVVRAVVSSVTEPLPWRPESLTMRAYLPEYLVWFAIIVLLPIGVLAGLRRDPMLTALLAAHAFAVMMMVAMTSGNVGTLIRHRGLVLPYAVWLSILGGIQLLRGVAPRPLAPSGETT
ncbi:MAG: hypothetical protein ACRD2N_17930 [Vicinamibacterales bacterium]